jgi:hypothetical protein
MAVSLRVTISAVVAFTVAVVAAVTLSITLTSSLQALRSIGKGHAAALLATAAIQTQHMFDEPQTLTDAIVNVTMRNAWDFPSNDPAVARDYLQYMDALFLASRRRMATPQMYFADNTRLGVYPVSQATIDTPNGMYGTSYDVASPLNESISGTDGQTMLQRVHDRYRYSDNSRVLPTDPDAPSDLTSTPPTPPKMVGTSFWTNLRLGSAQGFAKATLPMVPVPTSTAEDWSNTSLSGLPSTR